MCCDDSSTQCLLTAVCTFEGHRPKKKVHDVIEDGNGMQTTACHVVLLFVVSTFGVLNFRVSRLWLTLRVSMDEDLRYTQSVLQIEYELKRTRCFRANGV